MLHKQQNKAQKNSVPDKGVACLDSFPLPAIVFDCQTLAVRQMNTLWKTILHLSTLKSLSQLTMLVQLPSLIEKIKILSDLPTDQLPKTERCNIQIISENQIAFGAEWVMHRQPDTSDQIAVFLIPELSTQVDGFFDQSEYLAEDKKTPSNPLSNPSETIKNAESDLNIHYMVEMMQRFWGATPSRLFLLDTQGKFLMASKAYTVAHQTSTDDIVGGSLDDIYDAEIAFRLKGALNTTISGQSYHPYTFLIDDCHVLDILLMPFWDTAEQVIGVMGIETDSPNLYQNRVHTVTQPGIPPETERALQQQMRDIDMSFCFLLDGKGNLQFFNRAFFNLIASENPEEILTRFYQTLEGKQWYAENEALMTKNGQRFDEVTWLIQDQPYHLLLHRVSFVMSDNSIAGVLVSGINVTPQRQLEEQLQVINRLVLSKVTFLQQVMNAVPSPMLFIDTDGIIQNCNLAFAQIYHETPENIIGSALLSLRNLRVEKRLILSLFELMSTPGTLTGEYQIRYDGDTKTMLMTMATVYDHEMQPRGVVTVAADVTKHKRLEEELFASRERLDLAYRATRDGFWDWDAKVGKTYFSSKLLQLLKFDNGHFPIEDHEWFLSRFHPDNVDVQKILRDIQDGHLKTDELHYEFQYLCGDEQYHWFESNNLLLYDNNQKIRRMVGSIANIDTVKQKQADMAYQATHDALTGLPNRVLLIDRIEQALAIARRDNSQCAILFADLDFFKEINDRFGHDVGDQLLKEMSKRLTDCVREFDTVSRLGGDEFVLLLRNIRDTDEVLSVVKRVVHEAQKVFILEGEPSYISISIGVAIYPKDGDERKILMKRADEAMYIGKRGGRNRYVFWEEGMKI